MSDSAAEVDRWPQPPALRSPVIMNQVWGDVAFLHWRIPTSEAARFMPAGTVPDEYDGGSWVGLIGLRMRGAGFGRALPVPYFGTFTEVNVRLYSRDRDGVRGVVFLSLDASRLAAGLVYAAGLVVKGPPESVLYSPGVHARFGMPYTLS